MKKTLALLLLSLVSTSAFATGFASNLSGYVTMIQIGNDGSVNIKTSKNRTYKMKACSGWVVADSDKALANCTRSMMIFNILTRSQSEKKEIKIGTDDGNVVAATMITAE